MSIEAPSPESIQVETPEVDPAAVSALANESLLKIQGVETQSEAIDCILNAKMQCMEQGLPFDQVQEEMIAGWKDTVKNVGVSLIMGTIKNPQGLTAVGQLLS